jgi:hypothetical protein
MMLGAAAGVAVGAVGAGLITNAIGMCFIAYPVTIANIRY